MTSGYIDRGMKTTTNKAISAVTWIAIQAEHIATTGSLFAPEVAHRIMGAALVPGKRTVETWDALYAAAIEAEVTMSDAAEFGEG